MIKSERINRERRVFAILFLLISIFALVGSLYSWGSGFLFNQPKNRDILLPLVDLLYTFPLSLMAGYLHLKDHQFGYILGLILAGSLLYGSIAVYIEMYLMSSYPWYLIVPPISGIILSIIYTRWYYMIQD